MNASRIATAIEVTGLTAVTIAREQQMPSIRFYTRVGCLLCDKALDQVEPLARRYGIGIELVDIDLDLELLERYNHRVPVIEAGDGSVIDEGIVETSVLSAAFKNLR